MPSPYVEKEPRELADVLKERRCAVCHKPATTMEDVELGDGIATRLPYCDAHKRLTV